MSEIGKKPMAVIKGAMADGIVMPDEAIAIGNAMVADDGKVDARGAMLMFRHLHDKTEFISEEDRARLSDIAKLGLKQLFERRQNKLFWGKPHSKISQGQGGKSLFLDSIATMGSITSFAYFSYATQRYTQVTLDSKRGDYTKVALLPKSGSVHQYPLLIGNMEWFLYDLIPAQGSGVLQHAAQRKKLVALVDALEKGIYTKGNHRNTPAKLKGYSKKKSKRSDQKRIANKYFKSLAKRVPHSMFKIHGVTIRVRGEIAREIKEKIREAFRAFHPNELKAIGLLGFNIFDDRKLKNFVRSKLPGDPKRVHSTSTAFVYVSMPREVFISTHRYKNIVTLRHEIGHCLDNVYGKPSGKEYWGVAHHYRTYVLPCKDRACLIDRAVNEYAGDGRGSVRTSEWFTESRRLMMNERGYVGPDQHGFSTIAEFKRKDPVGFLVFTKYRQLLDDDHKHPQDAFSMTSFHEARKLVASSGGKVTEAHLKRWSKLRLDLQAERHVTRGMALMKKGKKERPAAIKEFRKALALIPEYSYARSQIAKALRDDGRHGESVRECEVLFERDPFLGGEHVGFLIKHYKEHEEHKKLLALYDKRLAQQPDWAEYHNLKANLLVKMGRITEVYDHLEKQAKRTGKIDYLIAIAKIANRKRDYKKVSWVFGELRKRENQLTKNCAEGYNYIGNLIYYTKIGACHEEAFWWYERGLKNYPTDLELNYNYAYTSALDLKMKDVNKAVFQRAMAYFEKQDPKTLYKESKAREIDIVEFAEYLISSRHYKFASIILSKLIEVRPLDISLRISYATTLHGTGQKSLFDKKFAHISGLGFDNDDLALWLIDVARFTAKDGDKATTIGLLDKLIAIDKGWGAAEYAAYHLKFDDEKAALQHLDKLRIAIAKGEYKASPELYARIGNVLYYSRDSRRYELALPWYEAGIREHPHDFELNYLYAWTALINAPAKSVKQDLLNQVMGYLTTLDAKTSLKNRKRIEKFVRQLARKGLKQHVWAFCENVNSKKRIPFIKKVIADSRHYRTDAIMYRAWLNYEPNSVAAHVGLSKALAGMRKSRDALKVLDTWNEEYLTHPDISGAKAKLASRVKLDTYYPKAIAELEEMEASRSDITLSADHYRLIANYYHKTKGDKQMAMEWYVHGTKRYPKDYKLHWESAELAMDLRDEQWLQQEIEILNKLDPTRYVSADVIVTSHGVGNEIHYWTFKRKLQFLYVSRESN